MRHNNNDHDDDNEMINDDDDNDYDDDNNDDSDKVSGKIIVSLGLFKLTDIFFNALTSLYNFHCLAIALLVHLKFLLLAPWCPGYFC